jgi:hypothetical protein
VKHSTARIQASMKYDISNAFATAIKKATFEKTNTIPASNEVSSIPFVWYSNGFQLYI